MELSLRAGARAPKPGVDALREGQAVQGVVRRVEAYGVFVELAASGVMGLAHISQASDQFVRDLGKVFKLGQRAPHSWRTGWASLGNSSNHWCMHPG